MKLGFFLTDVMIVDILMDNSLLRYNCQLWTKIWIIMDFGVHYFNLN